MKPATKHILIAAGAACAGLLVLKLSGVNIVSHLIAAAGGAAIALYGGAIWAKFWSVADH